MLDSRLGSSHTGINKSKLKIELNKTFKTICNAINPTSELRQMLEPSMKDVLIDRTDRIHQTMLDTHVQKEFIKSEFNKDPKSQTYRSPYTHRFYPQTEEHHSFMFREMEDKGKVMFDEYARLFFEEKGCINNFYVHEAEEGLSLAFYVKKIVDEADCSGIWCSSSVMQIRGDPIKSFTYKLESCMVYELKGKHGDSTIDIHGSIKKNRVESKKMGNETDIEDFHLVSAGKLIEETETLLRKQIENIFILKTKDIIFKTRFENSKEAENQRRSLIKEIMFARAENPRMIIQQ